MGRVELEQLKKTTLITFFEVARDMGLTNGKDYKYNQQEKTITFKESQSQILLYDLGWYPSDPLYDRLGSLELTGAFVDEAGQVRYRCWETLRTRIRWKLEEYNLIPKLFGSCNPVKSWPYAEFYKPFRDGGLPMHRQFIQALPTDNPFLSMAYIESLRTMKDKSQQQRLLYGNWEYDDDPMQLFPIDVIMDLFTNRTEQSDDRYITGDVSRKGRDRMILIYWEGWMAKEVVELPYEIRSDHKLAQDFIREYAQEKTVRMHHVLLDEDGIGGGLVDNLGCSGFVNNSAPIVSLNEKEGAALTGRKMNYSNLKSQCYFLFSMRAERGEVGIDCSSEHKIFITEELEQVKQKDADKDGKISVVGKDVVKEFLGRSPDFADALMMREWFPLIFGEIIEQTQELGSVTITSGLLRQEF